MTLSELILLIRWEVQKSINLVDELANNNSQGTLEHLQLGVEKFEFTIPISVEEREMYYTEVNKNVSDVRFRKFYYPLIIQSDEEIEGKANEYAAKKKGKVLDVKVISSNDDNSITRIGQMKIILSKT